MGCGASSAEAAVPQPTNGWLEDKGNDEGVCARREESEFHDRLDELVARLIFEEELSGGYMFEDNGHQGAGPPAKGLSLSAVEVNQHSSILTIDTQDGEVRKGDWASTLLKQECSMCLEEFAVGDQLRILHCNHTFHARCIDAWFARARTCPFCLRDITLLPPPTTPPPECRQLISPRTAPLNTPLKTVP